MSLPCLTGDFPEGHFNRKEELDRGVSWALVASNFLYDGQFRRDWVELGQVLPGTGEVSAFGDQYTGSTTGRLIRSLEVLEKHEHLLPPEIKDTAILDYAEMRPRRGGARFDLLLNITSAYRQSNMELSVLVSSLGLMIGRAPSPDSAFYGEVDGNGRISSGSGAVPPPHPNNVLAMRRGGIKRLHLGQPISYDTYPVNAIYDASIVDMGPGVEHLEVIVLGHVRDVFDRIADGPECIFPLPLIEGDPMPALEEVQQPIGPEVGLGVEEEEEMELVPMEVDPIPAVEQLENNQGTNLEPPGNQEEEGEAKGEEQQPENPEETGGAMGGTGEQGNQPEAGEANGTTPWGGGLFSMVGLVWKKVRGQ